MDRETMINEEVEKTLRALDDLPPLKGDPFLATRLLAQLAEERSWWRDLLPVGLRLKPALLAVVVILNILTIVGVLRTPAPSSSREDLISMLREEYHHDQDAY